MISLFAKRVSPKHSPHEGSNFHLRSTIYIYKKGSETCTKTNTNNIHKFTNTHVELFRASSCRLPLDSKPQGKQKDKTRRKQSAHCFSFLLCTMEHQACGTIVVVYGSVVAACYLLMSPTFNLNTYAFDRTFVQRS